MQDSSFLLYLTLPSKVDSNQCLQDITGASCKIGNFLDLDSCLDSCYDNQKFGGQNCGWPVVRRTPQLMLVSLYTCKTHGWSVVFNHLSSVQRSSGSVVSHPWKTSGFRGLNSIIRWFSFNFCWFSHEKSPWNALMEAVFGLPGGREEHTLGTLGPWVRAFGHWRRYGMI